MKQFVILILSLIAIASANSTPKEVRIAAYEYPPYFTTENAQHLVGDIVQALNAMQSDYQFSVVHIAPNGRYDALRPQGCCDVMLFEDRSWGWEQVDYAVQLSTPIYEDKERFVARKRINRGQSFFQVKGLRFGGIIGYHYSFVANEKDNRVLEEEYGIYLGHSHQVNLRMLLNGRLDLIMLADAYIRSVLTEETRSKLLLSEQHYGLHQLSAVTNPNKAINGDKLEVLLSDLRQSGKLQQIFAKHRL